MTDQKSPVNSRVAWLDSLRGLAIIVVVLGHINLGLMQAGLTQASPQVFKAMHNVLYLVHMPLFAFLFGLNIPVAWEKRQSWSYVRSRLVLFFYLYLVWTLIQGTFEVLGSRFSNGDTSWLDLVNIIQPLAHLWYLPWMMIIYLSLLILKPWRSLQRALGGLLVFLALSWLTWGINLDEFYGRGVAIFIFAFAGSLIGTSGLRILETMPVYLLLALALLTSGLFVCLSLSGQALTLPTLEALTISNQSKLLGMIASWSGVLLCLFWGSLIYRGVQLNRLERVGHYSLHIYLMHLLITPTFRIFLVKLGIQDPWFIMLVSLAGGVGIPLLVSKYFRVQLGWLFSLPPRVERLLK